MFLKGPPAEEPPGVPPYPGDVQCRGKAGMALLHGRLHVLRQGVDGRVQTPLEVLPVGVEPGPLVIEAEPPQKVGQVLGKSLEGGECSWAWEFTSYQ